MSKSKTKKKKDFCCEVFAQYEVYFTEHSIIHSEVSFKDIFYSYNHDVICIKYNNN